MSLFCQTLQRFSIAFMIKFKVHIITYEPLHHLAPANFPASHLSPFSSHCSSLSSLNCPQSLNNFVYSHSFIHSFIHSSIPYILSTDCRVPRWLLRAIIDGKTDIVCNLLEFVDQSGSRNRTNNHKRCSLRFFSLHVAISFLYFLSHPFLGKAFLILPLD